MGNIYLKSLLLFKMDLFIGVPLHKMISLLLKKNLQFCVIVGEKKQKEDWEPSMEKPGGVNIILFFSVGYNRKILVVQ